MKFLSALISLALLLLALNFALANRQGVAVSLWPFAAPVEMPLYLLSLGALIAGLLTGAAVAWLGMLPQRLAARRQRKVIASLQEKITDLQQTVIAPGQGALLPPPENPKWRFWKKSA